MNGETLAFHVDRGRALVPGQVLTCGPAPTMPAGGPDLAQEWPEGMTRHGHTYSTQWISGSTEAEWLFELVRRLEFPERVSRFTSLFAFATVGEARAFRASYARDLGAPIVQVAGTVAHRANMPLIGVATPPATVLARAREYWRGQAGPAPELWELLLHGPVRVVGPVPEDGAAGR